MEEKNFAPILAVHISDVLDVISSAKDPRVMFYMRDASGRLRHFVCKSFTLTLNHLFLLDLDEICYHFALDECGVAFVNAASTYDIIETIEELRIGENWCGFCRLPDGNFAVITNEITDIEGKCSIINILSMNNRRNE